ncbi:MAG: hypothetical protein ACJATV_000413 [Granulosicoccus sp.]|jgi:hypothetical protein
MYFLVISTVVVYELIFWRAIKKDYTYLFVVTWASNNEQIGVMTINSLENKECDE